MKKRIKIPLLLCLCALGSLGLAQESGQQCAAAFLGTGMIVDEYSPRGKCTLPPNTEGQLSVHVVELSADRARSLGKIAFKVAIRRAETNTLTMYSNQNYQEIDLSRILARCHTGDRIVLLTVNDRYSLPHNEIAIQ
ncbi:hypothetical protein [Persicitalea jodogahamensis]|uniref:Uncharacterized protein n=1 Tax=Persicitalea jodogahamensis TaxID=402147 RepID=A0A8J3D2T7_9BACT|nr:hypothetical protein [Persicitalea jodogahamensis]GHB63060.1 hypothetical protein GCM10007390_16120 [Persicitalea jodogahamensis]